jgi:uncharacterized membrane protein
MTISQRIPPLKFFIVGALTLSATTALAQQNRMDLLSNPDLKLITFDVPGASEGTVAMGITPKGEVVGYYGDANEVTQGFVRKADGEITTFMVTNSVFTIATAVNADGLVVGEYGYWDGGIDGTFLQLGFRRSPDGEYTDIQSIGVLGQVNGVNNKGIVVGDFLSEEEVWTSFLEKPNGTTTTFDALGTAINPGPTGTRATAINAEGQITGYYGDPTDNLQHGYIRQPDGKVVTFNVPGASSTNPASINNAGDIVGTNTNGAFLRKAGGKLVPLTDLSPVVINDIGEIAGPCGYSACLREPNGTVYEFKVPGAVGTVPTAMNVRGEITGIYYVQPNIMHSFILTSKRFRVERDPF